MTDAFGALFPQALLNVLDKSIAGTYHRTFFTVKTLFVKGFSGEGSQS